MIIIDPLIKFPYDFSTVTLISQAITVRLKMTSVEESVVSNVSLINIA